MHRGYPAIKINLLRVNPVADWSQVAGAKMRHQPNRLLPTCDASKSLRFKTARRRRAVANRSHKKSPSVV
jgi:hypothetical protein